MGIDPDVAEIIEPILTRLDALERRGTASVSEAALLNFQAKLFPALAGMSEDEQAALLDRLTRAIR